MNEFEAEIMKMVNREIRRAAADVAHHREEHGSIRGAVEQGLITANEIVQKFSEELKLRLDRSPLFGFWIEPEGPFAWSKVKVEKVAGLKKDGSVDILYEKPKEDA